MLIIVNFYGVAVFVALYLSSALIIFNHIHLKIIIITGSFSSICHAYFMNYYQLRKLNLFAAQTIEERVVKQKRPISIFYGNFPIIE